MQDQDYIKFEAYLSKELSIGEVTDFENRLKTDPKFNQAYTTYKELNTFLEHKFKNEDASNVFKNNLRTISNLHFSKEASASKKVQKTKVFNLYKYAIAACIVLFFGVFTYNQFSDPVYADYANYEVISLTVRGENNDLVKTAETAFNNKDFVKAEKAFASLIEVRKDDSELKLYRAISLIELNNFETSDGLLKDLGNGNSVYKDKAIWYLALSKLKQQKDKVCIDVLKTIPRDTEYYKRAQKLIKKLD